MHAHAGLGQATIMYVDLCRNTVHASTVDRPGPDGYRAPGAGRANTCAVFCTGQCIGQDLLHRPTRHRLAGTSPLFYVMATNMATQDARVTLSRLIHATLLSTCANSTHLTFVSCIEGSSVRILHEFGGGHRRVVWTANLLLQTKSWSDGEQ